MAKLLNLICKWVLICMMLGAVSGLTFCSYLTGADIHKAYVLSPSWHETTGKITSSIIEEHHGKGISYCLRVNYSYTAKGAKFSNDKMQFGINNCPSSRYEADLLLSRFPVEGQMPVYFNPKDPADSVLNRDGVADFTIFWFVISLSVLLLIVSLFFASMGDTQQEQDISNMMARRELMDHSIRIQVQDKSDGK